MTCVAEREAVGRDEQLDQADRRFVGRRQAIHPAPNPRQRNGIQSHAGHPPRDQLLGQPPRPPLQILVVGDGGRQVAAPPPRHD